MGIKDQPTNLGPVYEPVGGKPTDPTPYNSHPEQPFGASGGAPTDPEPTNIHPLAANLGWIIGGLVDGISWLLSNALNLFATVPDDGTQDAVMAVGSDTTARVWDETDGLVLATVSAGSPVSEGMRLSHFENEGAVASNLVSLDLTTATTTGTIVGDTIEFTASNQYALINYSFEVGKQYRVTYHGKANGKVRSNNTYDLIDGVYPASSTPITEIFVAEADDTKVQFLTQTTDSENHVLTGITIEEITTSFVNFEKMSVAVTGDSIADTPIPHVAFKLPATTYDTSLSGQMFSWVVSTGFPNAVATGASNILIHCGTNDITNGRTWAEVEADLDTIKGLLPTGVTLFIDEILPATSKSDADNLTIRTWNDNLATWCSANGAVLILSHDDMGIIRVSTGELDDLNPLWNLDGLHIDSYGDARLGWLWSEAIKSYYGSFVGLSTNTKLTPSKTGSNGEEIMLVHEGRENNEAIASQDHRVTPSALPHNWFYEQQAMPELADGALDSGVNWTAQFATAVFDNGVQTITGTSPTLGGRNDYLVEGLTVGETYRVEISAKRGVQGTGQVFQSWTFGTIPVTPVTSTTFEVYAFDVVSTSTSGFIRCYASSAGGIGDELIINSFSVTLAPKTSLTEPLRDSQGRYYEERVKNGGFDVDAEWTDGSIGSGTAVIAGGVLTVTGTDGSNRGSITSSIITETGKTYKISFPVTSVVTKIEMYLGTSLNGFQVGAWSWTADNASFSATFTALSDITYIRFLAGGLGGSAVFDNVSVVEVKSLTDDTPTNILDGGRRESGTQLAQYTEDLTTATTAWTVGESAVGLGRDITFAASSTSRLFQAIAIADGTAVTVSCLFDTDDIGKSVRFGMFNGSWDYGTDIVIPANGRAERTLIISGADSQFFGIVSNSSGGGYSVSLSTDGGFQVETGTEATEYIPNLDNTSSVTVDANVDESVLWSYGGRYNNIGAGHLTHVLNEPEATNLVLQSDSLNTSPWGQQGTSGVAENNTTDIADPLGGNTASKLTILDASRKQDVTTTSGTGVLTAYVYAGTATHVRLTTNDTLIWNTGVSQKFPLSFGWNRIELSGDLLPSSANNILRILIGGVDVDDSRDADCNGTLYVWGVNFIDQDTVSSTPIPTTTGTVTRAATSFSVPNPLPVNDFAIRGRVVDNEREGVNVLFNTDGDNRIVLYTNGASLGLDFYINNAWAGTTNVPNSITKGVPFNFGLIKSSTSGLTVSADGTPDASPTLVYDDLTGGGSLIIGTSLTGGITDLQLYTGSDLETWASDIEWSEAE